MFEWVLNVPLIPWTPPNYFCVRIIKTSRFFSTAESSTNPGTTQKIKPTYILLPFSINYISFVTAFHALVITSFSQYLLSCLSNGTGYCFTFSQISSSCRVSATIMATYAPLYNFHFCKCYCK